MAPAAVSRHQPPHFPFAIVDSMALAAATLASSPRVSISVSAAGMNSSGRSVSLGARRVPGISVQIHSQRRRMVASAAAARGDEGAGKTFVEEMRAAAMRMHTKDQASEGEKELEGPSLNELEPNLEAYLRFLVDSKLIFQTLENIVDRAAVPWYAEFQNTGLERSEALKKDLKWFSEQGHTIPEPSASDTKYASYLEELSEKDQQAFFCHFYNMYFGQSAGGRLTGKKIADKILNKKELEFYKWEGTLSELLQNVRTKLNQVASSWTREQKNRCLEETVTSFAYSVDRLRKIFT
ncbi:heme oxygenase 1, chloroplastic [Aegilops tauschii subsp. strangulata]|nr:heme oxygenase 1, chloroplastic [Aegilops tauschii subsp. strangulata]